MKKTKEITSLNSRVGKTRVGKSWETNSRIKDNSLSDNFILGMTNQTIESD